MKNYRIPPTHIVIDERAKPAEATEERLQPFLRPSDVSLEVLEQCDDFGIMNREGLALALSQVTARNILPPLVDMETGTEMLNYNVEFRAYMDPLLVRELALVLEENRGKLGWEQVSEHRFLSVIGAGVAACIETIPGMEHLELRYDSDLEHELFHAGCAPDRLRSRLFLQTALYERVDVLLEHLRGRVWSWL